MFYPFIGAFNAKLKENKRSKLTLFIYLFLKFEVQFGSILFNLLTE